MRGGAVIWSSMLHVAVLAIVIVGLPWRIERPQPAIVAAPIQGVIIDQAAIDREREKRDQAARQERQRQQEVDRQRREQQRVADQRAADEKQRVAAEQRARDEAKRKEEERVAAAKAEQQRRDEQAKAEREAQAQREKEAAEKRQREQAEARRRQQAESELQAQLAAEAEANAARAAGLQDQYMLMIQSHVKRFWQKPLSARPGIECVVNVVQLPTGDVVSAKVGQCNGDDAVRRSIENAVTASSPLPRPPSQAVFSRNFTITFAPDK
ncbi:MAG TPA: cell envelope integrity protein TolA [Gammaproteobacteria bacterium]|jgi:colicin import membrane protein|nr:cell envelope integrity protein TolA [Gammaproteobacteria bacterium]